MTSALIKKPVVWIVLLIASGLCVFTVLRYFGDAFSVLDLDVRMSRDEAIRDARRIATDRKLTTATLTEAAAGFSGDAPVQTFIELEGGGKPALKPLLGGEEFSLYKWRVRLYAPRVEPEVQIAFTPDGHPSGFFSKVPEAEAGAALSADDARAIAVAAAARDWNVDFTRYRTLTASAVTRPGKRVDHEFVYERKLDGAPPIGDGRLRLRLVVTGDRLTQLQRFVYVPEAFARRYETIRSVNNNIAAAASIAAGLLYGLGGCLIGLIWLMRRHAVRWGPAAKWAGVVAVLIAGAALVSISGSWFGYDTATSATTHLVTRIGGALAGGVVTWLLLTVIFATAEGLGRLAFGSHPQLWRSWRMPSAISRAIWGRTLAGYAWIGFDLAFIATFYFLVQRYLGWWSPSDALIDPNILGTPQPWITPVSMALQAGLMEESLFRAIPLAGAALIGRHFGREKTFIVAALVLQAIIFGCAHANYPGQPAYARPIELFLPSLVWGVVYLRYGLVPGILFHFGFDLVLMSIPLFVTDAPGILFDRAMVIGILALPLIVLIVQRLRAGRLIDLPDSERNAAAGTSGPQARAVDDAILDEVDAPTPVVVAPRSRRETALLAVLGLVGIVGLGLRLAQPYDAPRLTIDRAEAIQIAEHALADRGVQLDARWHRTAKAFGVADEQGARFAWKEGGRALYARLIGTTLPPPHWEVRFARFDGDVADRDAWRVSVVDRRAAPDGIRLIVHDIPEGRAGKRLSEGDARPLAEAAIAAWLKVPASSLRAVSAQATEQPARVDWQFRYADPSIVMPAGGEARIGVEIDGDEVASVGRSTFVPDAWARDQRRRNEGLVVPRALLGLLTGALSICVMVSLVRRLARGEASKRAAWVVALLIVVILSTAAALDFKATEFSFTVAEPYNNQVLRFALQWLGITAAAALFGALVAAVGVRIASRAEDHEPPSASRWRRWIPAVCLALLIAGVGGLGTLTGPAANARVPSVGAADSLAPALSAFSSALGFTTTVAGVVLAAAVLATRRRRYEILIAIGFVAAAALGRAAGPDTTVVAVLLSGIGGFVGWWIYRSQLRDRPGVIAPLLLLVGLLGLLPGLVQPAFPGARVAAFAGIVGTLLGYAIWRWLVKKDELVR
ncbi:MAG: CPBP family intramembrane glutamic endopeptidase [Burkholderiaceae bacterium]